MHEQHADKTSLLAFNDFIFNLENNFRSLGKILDVVLDCYAIQVRKGSALNLCLS